MSEHDEQAALLDWCQIQVNLGTYPELAYLFAIPNGGLRDKFVAARLQREGVKPGVPDLCLPVRRGKWPGLFLELKVKGGRLSRDQWRWVDFLDGQGYCVAGCYGWEEARDVLVGYMRLEIGANHG